MVNLLKAEKKGVKKGIVKTVHDLWMVKGMWEIDKNNLINQTRMVNFKGWVTNVEIEIIKRQIKNEGKDEVNNDKTQENDNTADIYNENDDINYGVSANEEPIE